MAVSGSKAPPDCVRMSSGCCSEGGSSCKGLVRLMSLNRTPQRPLLLVVRFIIRVLHFLSLDLAAVMSLGIKRQVRRKWPR